MDARLQKPLYSQQNFSLGIKLHELKVYQGGRSIGARLQMPKGLKKLFNKINGKFRYKQIVIYAEKYFKNLAENSEKYQSCISLGS